MRSPKFILPALALLALAACGGGGGSSPTSPGGGGGGSSPTSPGGGGGGNQPTSPAGLSAEDREEIASVLFAAGANVGRQAGPDSAAAGTLHFAALRDDTVFPVNVPINTSHRCPTSGSIQLSGNLIVHENGDMKGQLMESARECGYKSGAVLNGTLYYGVIGNALAQQMSVNINGTLSNKMDGRTHDFRVFLTLKVDGNAGSVTGSIDGEPANFRV